ncbi:aminopeptidase N [Calidifontibacter terrae]
MPVLLQTEAVTRAALVTVNSYEVDLDLTTGDELFGSRCQVQFSAATVGASTFLDLKAHSVESITLNGRPIDPASVTDGRVELPDLAQDNTVIVASTMAYSHDGQGLHRAVDPADGEAYVYGMSFLDAAPQVFACFDQPDLKAPYNVSVKAPDHWLVIGNGAERQEGSVWHLATTKPLSTYFWTICAGPYAVVRDEYAGVPLGVFGRASLRTELERHAPQMLEVTKAGIDFYNDLFGIDYPWGKYDQVFVPEFNAGAMENPGCVTFRDQMLFRGTPSRAELLSRTNTILHEMAHMWFGDLVSMKWWDDLWLNESFAEYMAHRSCSAATEFDNAWVDFGALRKNWGYQADRAPSTHPIAGNAAADSDSALANFDGISYAKGCSALRQLAAYVGDEAFVAGVRDYLTKHSYGNATLADFLAAIAGHTDRDLAAWSAVWLETSGTDVFAVEVAGDPIQRAEVRVTPAHDGDVRPHVTDVAGFTDGEQVWRTDLFELSVNAPQIPVTGRPAAKLVVPNASDLTWAIASFDADSLAAIPEQLPQIGDAGVRGVVWSALLNGAFLATVDPRRVIDTFTRAWPRESDDSVRSLIPTTVAGRIVLLLPPTERAAQRARIADTAEAVLSESTGAAQLVPARLVAGTTTDVDLLSSWADGSMLPSILDGDLEFRWLAMQRLAELGAVDDAAIDQFGQQDRSMAGARNVLTAKASRPNAAAKQAAWKRFGEDDSLSNYEAAAIAQGLFEADDLDLVRPYVARYFEVLPTLAKRFGEYAAQRVATAAFPHALTDADTQAQAHAMVRGTNALSANVRRSLVDETAKLDEALRSQEVFGG